MMYTALTIAGSDSSGGAGIQADIKTMTANRVYAMSAITALTAQNTTGVTDIMEVTPKFLAEQLDSIFTDIRPDAIKTGMVSSSELIETIAEKLGIQSFIVRNGLRYARSFTQEQLRYAVETAVQTETDVKTGKLDEKLAVELVIVEMSK